MNNSEERQFLVSDQLKDNTKKAYLCVVMPAYNEANNIKDNLLEASKIISGFVKNYQIIAVNDGSLDDTEAGIIEAADEDSKITYVSYNINGGKGYAIATGVSYANAEYIAFLDSDLELSPTMLRYFLRALKSTDADIAIGSKLHKKSKINYPLSRKIISIGYYIILKTLFRLKLKDTQTGIKLFKADVIKPICQTLESFGFAFDIEILAKATKKGHKIIELPIELEFKREKSAKTRFPIKQIYKIFTDTLAVRKAIKK